MLPVTYSPCQEWWGLCFARRQGQHFGHNKNPRQWRGFLFKNGHHRDDYIAIPPVMPLRSLLMGITSFAPGRHIRMMR